MLRWWRLRRLWKEKKWTRQTQNLTLIKLSAARLNSRSSDSIMRRRNRKRRTLQKCLQAMILSLRGEKVMAHPSSVSLSSKYGEKIVMSWTRRTFALWKVQKHYSQRDHSWTFLTVSILAATAWTILLMKKGGEIKVEVKTLFHLIN